MNMEERDQLELAKKSLQKALGHISRIEQISRVHNFKTGKDYCQEKKEERLKELYDNGCFKRG